MQKKHRRVVTEQVKRIPRKKWYTKVVQSLLGIAIAIGGAFLPRMGFPWWVGGIVIFMGGWIGSKDVIKSGGKYIVATGKDVMEIWSSRGGTDG